MSGKFYAVGVGPGDPELITLKAVNIIKNSDIIVVPRSGAAENIAVKITREYITDKHVLESDMPMIKDKSLLDKYHDESASQIAKLLDYDKVVSFLTIGDPSIYSTVMYVHRRLTKMGYDTAIIPGVPSFCGAAASLNTSLCERDEMLHIIPATYKGHQGKELTGTRVLMKSGKDIIKLKDELAEQNAMMVERATMDNEKIYNDISDLNEQSSYFSLIVIHSKDREREN